MANVEDPAIIEAVEDVVSDASETTWLILGYEGPKSNTVLVQEKGDGDAIEAVKEHLKEDECQYCYLRVTAGDEESVRTKFIFLTWVGAKVSAIKRAKISVHKADIKKVIRYYSIELHATDMDDIDKEAIMEAITKAGGANYSFNS